MKGKALTIFLGLSSLVVIMIFYVVITFDQQAWPRFEATVEKDLYHRDESGSSSLSLIEPETVPFYNPLTRVEVVNGKTLYHQYTAGIENALGTGDSYLPKSLQKVVRKEGIDFSYTTFTYQNSVTVVGLKPASDTTYNLKVLTYDRQDDVIDEKSFRLKKPNTIELYYPTSIVEQGDNLYVVFSGADDNWDAKTLMTHIADKNSQSNEPAEVLDLNVEQENTDDYYSYTNILTGGAYSKISEEENPELLLQETKTSNSGTSTYAYELLNLKTLQLTDITEKIEEKFGESFDPNNLVVQVDNHLITVDEYSDPANYVFHQYKLTGDDLEQTDTTIKFSKNESNGWYTDGRSLLTSSLLTQENKQAKQIAVDILTGEVVEEKTISLVSGQLSPLFESVSVDQ